jgi:hypothetical protein
MNNTVKLEKWKIAQKRRRLSDKQVQMARELGMNADKLGKLDNHKQEPWKTPLPQHIENLYYKHFGKEEPDTVKSINQLLKEDKIKKEKHKKEKERKRKAKLREDGPLTEDSGEAKEEKPVSLRQKIKSLDTGSRVRIKIDDGDTPDVILQKEAHIFDEAFDFYEKERVTFSELGFILKKIHPRYKPRRYGCKTLGAIYEKSDRYEVIRTEGKGTYEAVRKKENGES